jgi:hypothetical protein
MFGHSVRVVVAILTFTIGIVLVRVLQLIPHLETAFVDRFFIVNETDLSPIALFDPAEDANEIYRLVIQKKFMFNNEVKLIVLQAETTGFPMYENESSRKEGRLAETFHQIMKEVVPEAQLQTFEDYLARNETSQPLKVSNLGISYVLVKKSDLPDDGLGRFWTRFYQKYPNSSGLIFFSEIGFNSQHDQAFLYAGRGCGGLCGSGEYVLLSKINGKWEIRKEIGLWVS